MFEPKTPLPHRLCENLCSKKLYMLSDDREVMLEDLQTAGYENYWCRHSQTDTGPDGGWVTYDNCAPHRGCYVPSPHLNAIGARVLQEDSA